MERSSLVLVASLFVIAAVQPARPSAGKCNPSDCPTLECADPVYAAGSCCPSCANSNCRFSGCVNFGAFGPRWLPDPCTVCECLNGQEHCTHIECTEPQCFGYPTTLREGECCRVCDFGIREDACGVIPAKTQAIYAALGDRSCREEVVTHGCDKDFVMVDGVAMKCVPNERLTAYRFTNPDCPFKKVTYKDVRTCQVKRANPDEIPTDWDRNSRECQLYFEPIVARNTTR